MSDLRQRLEMAAQESEARITFVDVLMLWRDCWRAWRAETTHIPEQK
jgi:hypothetical protein